MENLNIAIDGKDPEDVNEHISCHPICLSKTKDITLIKGWRKKQFCERDRNNGSRNVFLLSDDLKNYTSDEPVIEDQNGINLDSLRVFLLNDHFKSIGEKIKNRSNSELIKNLDKKIISDDLDQLDTKLNCEPIIDNAKDTSCESSKSVDDKIDSENSMCSKSDKLNSFVNETVDKFLCHDTAAAALQLQENPSSLTSVKDKSPNLLKSDNESESNSSCSGGSSYIYVPRIPIKSSKVVTIVDPIFDEYGRKPKTVYDKRRLLEGHKLNKSSNNTGSNESLRHFQYIGRRRKFDDNFRIKNAGKILNDKFINSLPINDNEALSEINKFTLSHLLPSHKLQSCKKYNGNKLGSCGLKTKKNGSIRKKILKKSLARKLKRKAGKLKKLIGDPVYVRPLVERLNHGSKEIFNEPQCVTSHNIQGNYTKNRKALMLLYLGLGRSLYQEQLINLNFSREDDTVINDFWANFSASAVLDRNDPFKLKPLVVPVVCPRLIAFMKESGYAGADLSLMKKNLEAFKSSVFGKENSMATNINMMTQHNSSATEEFCQVGSKNLQRSSVSPRVPVSSKNCEKVCDDFKSVNDIRQKVILRSRDNMFNTDNIRHILSEVASNTNTRESSDEGSVKTDKGVTNLLQERRNKVAGNSYADTEILDNNRSPNDKVNLRRPILSAWRSLGKIKSAGNVGVDTIPSKRNKSDIIFSSKVSRLQMSKKVNKHSDSAKITDSNEENLNMLHKLLSKNFTMGDNSEKAAEFDKASMASSDISENSPTKRDTLGSANDKMADSDSFSQVSLDESDVSENSSAKKLNFRRVMIENGQFKYTGKSCRVARELKRLNSDFLEIYDNGDNSGVRDENKDSVTNSSGSLVNSSELISSENIKSLLPDDIMKKKLAKVEKEYHQTVMKSNDEIIFLSSYSERNKRIKKLPKKLQGEDVVLLGDKSQFFEPIKDLKKRKYNRLLDMDEINSIIRHQRSKQTDAIKTSTLCNAESNLSSNNSDVGLDSDSDIELSNSATDNIINTSLPKRAKITSPQKLLSEKLKKLEVKNKNNLNKFTTVDGSSTVQLGDKIMNGKIQTQLNLKVSDFPDVGEPRVLPLKRPPSLEELNVDIAPAEKSEFLIPKNKDACSTKFSFGNNDKKSNSTNKEKIYKGQLVKTKIQKLKDKFMKDNNFKSGINKIVTDHFNRKKKNRSGRKMKSSNSNIKVNHDNESDELRSENKNTLKMKLRCSSESFVTSGKRVKIKKFYEVKNGEGCTDTLKSKLEFDHAKSSDATVNTTEAERTTRLKETTILVQNCKSILKPNHLRINRNSFTKDDSKQENPLLKTPYVLLEKLIIPRKVPVWCMDHRQHDCYCLKHARIKRRVAVKRVCPMYNRFRQLSLYNKFILQRKNNGFKMVNFSNENDTIEESNNSNIDCKIVQTYGNNEEPNDLINDTNQNNNDTDKIHHDMEVISDNITEIQSNSDIDLIVNGNDYDQSSIVPRIESIMSLRPEEFYADTCPQLTSNGFNDSDFGNVSIDKEQILKNDCASTSSANPIACEVDCLNPRSTAYRPRVEEMVICDNYRFFCIYMRCRFTYIRFLGGPDKHTLIPSNKILDLIAEANKSRQCVLRPLEKFGFQYLFNNVKLQFGIYAIPDNMVVFFGPYGPHERNYLRAFQLGLKCTANIGTSQSIRSQLMAKSIPFILPSSVKNYPFPHIQAQWWDVIRNASNKNLVALFKNARIVPYTTSISSPILSSVSENDAINLIPSGSDPEETVQLSQSDSTVILNEVNVDKHSQSSLPCHAESPSFPYCRVLTLGNETDSGKISTTALKAGSSNSVSTGTIDLSKVDHNNTLPVSLEQSSVSESETSNQSSGNSDSMVFAPLNRSNLLLIPNEIHINLLKKKKNSGISITTQSETSGKNSISTATVLNPSKSVYNKTSVSPVKNSVLETSMNNLSSSSSDSAAYVPEKHLPIILKSSNVSILKNKVNGHSNASNNTDSVSKVNIISSLDPYIVSTAKEFDSKAVNVKCLQSSVLPFTKKLIKVTNSDYILNQKSMGNVSSNNFPATASIAVCPIESRGNLNNNCITKTVSMSKTKSSTYIPILPKPDLNSSPKLASYTLMNMDNSLIVCTREKNVPVTFPVSPDRNLMHSAVNNCQDEDEDQQCSKLITVSSVGSPSNSILTTSAASNIETKVTTVNASETVINTNANSPVKKTSTDCSVICLKKGPEIKSAISTSSSLVTSLAGTQSNLASTDCSVICSKKGPKINSAISTSSSLVTSFAGTQTNSTSTDCSVICSKKGPEIKSAISTGSSLVTSLAGTQTNSKVIFDGDNINKINKININKINRINKRINIKKIKLIPVEKFSDKGKTFNPIMKRKFNCINLTSEEGAELKKKWRNPSQKKSLFVLKRKNKMIRFESVSIVTNDKSSNDSNGLLSSHSSTSKQSVNDQENKSNDDQAVTFSDDSVSSRLSTLEQAADNQRNESNHDQAKTISGDSDSSCSSTPEQSADNQRNKSNHDQAKTISGDSDSSCSSTPEQSADNQRNKSKHDQAKTISGDPDSSCPSTPEQSVDDQQNKPNNYLATKVIDDSESSRLSSSEQPVDDHHSKSNNDPAMKVIDNSESSRLSSSEQPVDDHHSKSNNDSAKKVIDDSESSRLSSSEQPADDQQSKSNNDEATAVKICANCSEPSVTTGLLPAVAVSPIHDSDLPTTVKLTTKEEVEEICSHLLGSTSLQNNEVVNLSSAVKFAVPPLSPSSDLLKFQDSRNQSLCNDTINSDQPTNIRLAPELLEEYGIHFTNDF